MPTITSPITQVAGPALLAILLLCLGTAILRADEGRPPMAVDIGSKHCRIYFGCLPIFTKQDSRLN